MNIFPVTEKNLQSAAKLINAGELVIFPTETVYGIGADGFNPIAVSKIFEAKKRPTFNPLILHISDYKMLDLISNDNTELIKRITNKYWPGPLTIVLKRNKIVPDMVTAGNETVALRMPSHPAALKLIELAGVPIAAPSANSFNRLSPTKANHISDELSSKVKMILDGGKSEIGVESTIIRIENDGITLLRPGGITLEDLKSVIENVRVDTSVKLKPDSPGQLEFHYAPDKPIFFITKDLLNKIDNKRVGGLFFLENKTGFPFIKEYILSPNGDLREAAANLFSMLYKLENDPDIDIIAAEKIEELGLGIAIMDRLKKAVNKFKFYQI
ncbi:MAG: L-threonylcarbamoyladenylate synthase [Melioribacteraceae bacterium]|nr:L-threonylcarbamoyladenylate synthase [Melioribacteraceae bacterium]